jgi:beta-glucanase (GH16 family)
MKKFVLLTMLHLLKELYFWLQCCLTAVWRQCCLKAVLLVLISCISMSCNKHVQSKTDRYTLVWSDEFNGTGSPDTTKWGFDIGKGDWGWGNNEQQYYTRRPENAYMSGGTLKIIGKEESYLGSSFTSARLLTKGIFSQTYGKIEVKAKVPKGAGTWPAFWMLGNDISSVGWPKCGELDILEHIGRTQDTIYGTLHYPEHSGGKAVTSTTVVRTASTAFHTYGVEWSADSIKFYVDDAIYARLANQADMPFHHNYHILLNMALGGNFGGPLDPAFKRAVFEVDYVRVYK